jgi:hypothetical protein
MLMKARENKKTGSKCRLASACMRAAIRRRARTDLDDLPMTLKEDMGRVQMKYRWRQISQSTNEQKRKGFKIEVVPIDFT